MELEGWRGPRVPPARCSCEALAAVSVARGGVLIGRRSMALGCGCGAGKVGRHRDRRWPIPLTRAADVRLREGGQTQRGRCLWTRGRSPAHRYRRLVVTDDDATSCSGSSSGNAPSTNLTVSKGGSAQAESFTASAAGEALLFVMASAPGVSWQQPGAESAVASLSLHGPLTSAIWSCPRPTRSRGRSRSVRSPPESTP